jgi:hypothetical protein
MVVWGSAADGAFLPKVTRQASRALPSLPRVGLSERLKPVIRRFFITGDR